MKYSIAALFLLLAWLFASEGLGFLAFATIIVLVVLALAGYGSGGGAVAKSPDFESKESEKHSEPWGEPSA